MSRFTGWPDEALLFFEGLEADNSKTYWTAHKDVYESAVRAPMLALSAELTPEFGELKIFRPYRDTRFARDKSPYKTAIGAFTGELQGVGYYVQLSATGLFVGGGCHHMTPGQVANLRTAVDDERTGTDVECVVADLETAGYAISGEQLKTVPRGFHKEHPRARLLRHKGLTSGTDWEPAAWLHTRKTLDRIVKVWRDLAPLNDWLAKHVGPPETTR